MKIKMLSQEQENRGLYVCDDEDMVYLHHGKKVIAAWSARSASRETIIREAQKYIAFQKPAHVAELEFAR